MIKKLNCIEIVDENKLQSLMEKINSFDFSSSIENPFIIFKFFEKPPSKSEFILRDEDKFSWQFSNKGYFNFKNNIPKILSSFNTVNYFEAFFRQYLTFSQFNLHFFLQAKGLLQTRQVFFGKLAFFVI